MIPSHLLYKAGFSHTVKLRDDILSKQEDRFHCWSHYYVWWQCHHYKAICIITAIISSVAMLVLTLISFICYSLRYYSYVHNYTQLYILLLIMAVSKDYTILVYNMLVATSMQHEISCVSYYTSDVNSSWTGYTSKLIAKLLIIVLCDMQLLKCPIICCNHTCACCTVIQLHACRVAMDR